MATKIPELVTNAFRIEQLKAREKAIVRRLDVINTEAGALKDEQTKNKTELAELDRRNDQLSRI